MKILFLVQTTLYRPEKSSAVYSGPSQRWSIFRQGASSHASSSARPSIIGAFAARGATYSLRPSRCVAVGAATTDIVPAAIRAVAIFSNNFIGLSPTNRNRAGYSPFIGRSQSSCNPFLIGATDLRCHKSVIIFRIVLTALSGKSINRSDSAVSFYFQTGIGSKAKEFGLPNRNSIE